MTIALETDSIEVIEEQVITKIFKVKIGNQLITLDAKQASQLYLQLKKKFRKEEEFAEKFGKILEEASKIGFEKYEDTFIPVGYKHFATEESISRKDVTSIHYYHYFKNARGEYGFLIKNGTTKPFAKLGRINDASSNLGKIIKGMPKDRSTRKSYFVSNGINTNNQRVKACMDILVLEGYLTKKMDMKTKIDSYRVTEKIKELEFDDNIEPLKVQVAPTQ